MRKFYCKNKSIGTQIGRKPQITSKAFKCN
jgi:hypothetical protein